MFKNIAKRIKSELHAVEETTDSRPCIACERKYSDHVMNFWDAPLTTICPTYLCDHHRVMLKILRYELAANGLLESTEE